jgi:hypothetical protein
MLQAIFLNFYYRLKEREKVTGRATTIEREQYRKETKISSKDIKSITYYYHKVDRAITILGVI